MKLVGYLLLIGTRCASLSLVMPLLCVSVRLISESLQRWPVYALHEQSLH